MALRFPVVQDSVSERENADQIYCLFRHPWPAPLSFQLLDIDYKDKGHLQYKPITTTRKALSSMCLPDDGLEAAHS